MDYEELFQCSRCLVNALDSAFISSWQSTAAWQKQLDQLREVVHKELRQREQQENFRKAQKYWLERF
jgi:hypothetical protein